MGIATKIIIGGGGETIILRKTNRTVGCRREILGRNSLIIGVKGLQKLKYFVNTNHKF